MPGYSFVCLRFQMLQLATGSLVVLLALGCCTQAALQSSKLSNASDRLAEFRCTQRSCGGRYNPELYRQVLLTLLFTVVWFVGWMIGTHVAILNYVHLLYTVGDCTRCIFLHGHRVGCWWFGQNILRCVTSLFHWTVTEIVGALS